MEPVEPRWRDKCDQNRVRRGSRYFNCACSICNLPSRVRARWPKISRISAVRSMILQPKIFSKLRVCAGESSSSKMTVSTSFSLHCLANSSALPGADVGGGDGRGHFLHALADDLCAGGLCEFFKFGEGFAHVGGGAGFEFHADEEDADGARVAGLDERFQIFVTASLANPAV